jgi:hypothetical protein
MPRLKLLEVLVLVVLILVFLIFVGPALLSAKSWLAVIAAIAFGLALFGWVVSIILYFTMEICDDDKADR